MTFQDLLFGKARIPDCSDRFLGGPFYLCGRPEQWTKPGYVITFIQVLFWPAASCGSFVLIRIQKDHLKRREVFSGK